MSDNMTPVELGTLLIDFTWLKPVIERNPIDPKLLDSLYSEQENYSEVQTEIVSNQAILGKSVGIPDADVAEMTEASQVIAQIDMQLPALRSLLWTVENLRAVLDDKRQRVVSNTAATVEVRAKKMRKPELLLKYQKARAYRSANAKKAARTRRRRAAQAAAQANQAQTQPARAPQVPVQTQPVQAPQVPVTTAPATSVQAQPASVATPAPAPVAAAAQASAAQSAQ